jgi:DNA modification methylase
MENTDLFGNKIIENVLLRDKFTEPPFSVLDSKTINWQNRKKKWISIGIQSENGRKKGLTQLANASNYDYSHYKQKYNHKDNGTSIFDPALCEVLYHWFCKENGEILDPFAGGSVRGIVANFLGYKYTGIDIRQEQIDSNREQGLKILDVNNQPQWYVGDSNEVLNNFNKEFDFVFSCPPYADLEVYSDLDGDISNKPYEEFLELYESIIKKSCNLLKSGGYACFVVGEVRDKNGYYIGFVPDTIKAFEKCEMKLYNEAIYLQPIGNAPARCSKYMKNNKLVKIHQNILIFKKPLTNAN